MHQLAEQLGIDMELGAGGNVQLYSDRESFESVAENVAAMQAAGLGHHVEMWDSARTAAEIGTSTFFGAKFSSEAFRIHPVKFVLGMLEASLGTGSVNLQTQTQVTAVVRKEANTGFQLFSSRGRVNCSTLVHATNGYLAQLVPEFAGIVTPVQGQVGSSDPQVRQVWGGYSMGYPSATGDYGQQRPDGTILLGGFRGYNLEGSVGMMDDSFVDLEVSAALQPFLPNLYPETLGNLTFTLEWTGVMGFSSDGFPHIGSWPPGDTTQVPPSPLSPSSPPLLQTTTISTATTIITTAAASFSSNVPQFLAGGFTGSGMCRSFGAGKSIAAILDGRQPDYWASLYLPTEERLQGVTVAEDDGNFVLIASVCGAIGGAALVGGGLLFLKRRKDSVMKLSKDEPLLGPAV
jgi:glycine/D-amino acid oxidase-like deaminating enzyme